jgi:hypothetical protein
MKRSVCLVAASSVLIALAMFDVRNARAQAVEALSIESPHDHWRQGGFVGLVPSIHVPRVHGTRDVLQVWLSLPDGGRIDARDRSEADGGHVLVLPAGSRVDRVEYRVTDSKLHWGEQQYMAARIEDPNEQLEITDVRGIVEQGESGQQFRILRRESGKPQAPLIGWAWNSGDESARKQVRRSLEEHLASARRPVGRPPLEHQAIEAILARTDCAGCHVPAIEGEPADIEQARARVRDTDASGLYTVMAVLQDHVDVSNHRLLDVNHDDPFVEVRCGDRPARLEMDIADREQRFVCPDGGAPLAHRNVESALAEGHDYTERLCEARRFLFERSTPEAHAAFQESFAVCGIGEGRER